MLVCASRYSAAQTYAFIDLLISGSGSFSIMDCCAMELHSHSQLAQFHRLDRDLNVWKFWPL